MNIYDKDGVTVMQLTGGTASQSFSREFLPKIRDAIISSMGKKAVVITGEGKFFSAGADIDAFKTAIEENDSVNLIRDLTGILHPLILKMRSSKTIFVAAINGACAGGGLGLALACDSRIGSPNTKIAASYAGIGLSPDGGTTWLLPRLVGEQTSRRFFFENAVWNADESLRHGVIDELVEDENLIDRAIEVANHWSQWGDHTKEATKHLLLSQNINDFETHLKHERTLIEAAGLTPEFEAGVEAFLARRNKNN